MSGKCLQSARLAAIDDEEDYDNLSRSSDDAAKAKIQKYIKRSKCQKAQCGKIETVWIYVEVV